MANEINIPIVTEAIKAFDLLIAKVDVLDKKMQEATQHFIDNGKKMASAITPTSVNENAAAIDALTKKINDQAKAIEKLTNDAKLLNASKKQTSQLSAQEAVNQGILNKNALEAARINSTLAGAYFKLNAEHAKASRLLQDLIIRGKLATQTQSQYNKELEEAKKDFQELNTRILAADKAIGKFSRNVGNYPMASGLKDLLSAFGVVTGVNLFASLVKNGFQAAKELQSVNLALKAVTATQAEYEKQTLFLTAIAEKYGLEIQGLTEQFTSFYVAAKGKLAGKDIQLVFENISKAGSALGVSNDTLKRSFMALNQMLSKGKVASEELRGQLAESLPGAVQAMTRAVQILHPEIKNLTEAGLFEMIKAGKILADEVLPETSKQLVILTGADKVSGIDTLTKTTNRLTNAWSRMIQSINDSDSSGFSLFVKNIVNGLTTILDFTGLLFKDEKQLQQYFQNIGKVQGLNEYQEILANIASTSKEQQEATKKALIERERETLKTNLAIIASEKKKRESIVGGDRALFHLQTKAEEDALVQVGKSSAILKAISEERIKDNTKVTSSAKELTKAELKAIEDALKAQFEANKKELELRALKQETILNGETNTYKEQYDALEKYLDLKMQIIKLDYNEQVRLAKGNADKIKSADLDMQMAIIKQTQDGFSKIKSIRKKENDDYIQEIKDIEAFLKKYHEDKDSAEQISQDIENASFKSFIDNYEKKIARLKELKAATKDYLDSFGSELAENTGFGETFNIFFKQIEGVDGKMTTMFQNLWEGADTSAKKFAVAFNAIAQTAQEAFNFVTEASNKNFDAEKERLQAQYDVNVKYAGDSASAKEKLEADFEKSKKDIAYREAKAKQKQALFNIAIDTAQAVASAVAQSPLTFGLPWSAFALAMGITQAALVSSQKIPQYWMGGTHEGGLMMVNDGKESNYKETVVTPDGKIHKPQGKNVIMNAPKGTEIYTHKMWNEKLNDMLQGKGIDMLPQNIDSFNYNEFDRIIGKHLGNITSENISIDSTGFNKWIDKNGNKTRAIGSRMSGKGLKF